MAPSSCCLPVSLPLADVYSIEPAEREPVGGASRLAYKVKEFREQGENPLVLFSGDAYNPSLMSTMTLGAQMVPILNEIGVTVSCMGIVAEFMKLMGEKMDEEVAETLVELDGRFQTVRNRESNLGNFVCDVWRKAAGAEIAILNSGSLRSDTLHPIGKLKARDFVAILPMLDETVVLECTGEQVVIALENAVSQWPRLEGRFPQVSGLKFKFDPAQPPGARVVAGSVFVTDFDDELEDERAPLLVERRYRVAVKEYLAQGKDGFSVFTGCKVLVDGEAGVALPTALKNHCLTLSVLSEWDPNVKLSQAAAFWRERTRTSHSLHGGSSHLGEGEPSHAPARAHKHREHGVAVHNPASGGFCIAPAVEGRIVNVQEEAAARERQEEEREEERRHDEEEKAGKERVVEDEFSAFLDEEPVEVPHSGAPARRDDGEESEL
ncbi:Trifunctional nucleotide phosphoesterase protein YfkN [Tetrabaena socialis]|uniref:Trifunctional nucleotide phosphoesterase protein YfkN n=1 Tax=Tetrabaena socialis TaxID=47790 RepID=A0A2J8A027_9CHLO|nr:Trifunctional nucleotide phosphoesterase protein YfkN [Tetrabaena socialis]|eukprot:PNH05856.1 Trifunctional nucleotide phosphoesterase protein YfkN [Tetrabaena socialis]